MQSILTVSETCSLIKQNLNSINTISVEGQIQNLKINKHCYFSLCDQSSKIDCSLFASIFNTIKIKLEDGKKVKIKANVDFYGPSGRLNLVVVNIEEIGLGDLFEKYQLLLAKLSSKGYFLESNKKIKPKSFPLNVCIITANKSEAYYDMEKQFRIRWPICNCKYYFCQMQGEKAPQSIISILDIVDELNYDAIVISRGGGSFEDLFCFNDEKLADKIFNLNTYTICAIGHEKNFTIAELVSDKRCSTPTEAITYLCPDINNVIDNILDIQLKLTSNIKNYINSIDSTLKYNKKVLENTNNTIDNLLNNIKNNKLNLSNLTKSFFKNYDFKLIKKNLNLSVLNNINNYHIDNLKNSLTSIINKTIEFKLSSLKQINNNLKIYSKQTFLNKGFNLIYKNNKLINTIDKIDIGDIIDIELKDSNIKAKILEVNKRENI